MSIAKNIIWYSLYSYLLMPVTVGANILLRKWIDPYHLGLINILVIFVTYSLFSNLGTLSYAEIKLPYLKGKGDESAYEELRYYAYWASTLGGVLFALLLVLFFFIWKGESAPELKNAVMVYFVYFIAYQRVSYYITLNRASGNFVFLAKFQFVSSLMTNCAMVVAAFFFGFMGYVWATASLMVIQVFFLRWGAGPFVHHQINIGAFLNLIRRSWGILYFGLISVLLRSVDSILVGFFFGAAGLGHYSLAPIGTTMIFAVTNSVGNVLFSRMQVELGREKEDVVFDKYISRPLIISALFLPLGIVFLYYLMPPLIEMVAPAFLPGIFAFKVLIWGAYFFSMINIISAYLISKDRQLALSKIYLLAISCVIVMELLLWNTSLGLSGVAFSISFGYLIAFGLVFFLAIPQWCSTEKVYQLGAFSFLSPVACLIGVLLVDYVAEISGLGSRWFNLPQLTCFIFIWLAVVFILNYRMRLLDKYLDWFRVVKNGSVLHQ